MSEDRFLELAPLAALGALDGEDRAAFEAHVRDCAACQAELRAHEAVAARLGAAAERVPPAPALRERVMQAAVRERRPTTAVGPLAWLSIAAALVLAVAFLVSRAQRDEARREAQQAAAERDRARAELDAARRELDTARARLVQAEAVRELLARPETRTATLAGLAAAPSARARVVWDPSSREAVLMVSGLEPAPAGKGYAVWVIGTGAPVAAGVFQVDASGRAMFRLPVRDETARVKTFAVTVEPWMGTPAPTGPMVLAGAVS
jgi:Anti-sigma-K factor rskA/Putative zinc-finger